MIGLSAAPRGSNASFTEVFDASGAERASAGATDNERLRGIVEDIVACVCDVDPALLRLPNRGRANVALARQVAMYIAHIGYGLNLTDVGVVFGRDRTTVAHACSVVEMRREDTEFDTPILLIELIIRAVNGPYSRTQAKPAGWVRQDVSGSSMAGAATAIRVERDLGRPRA